VSVKKRIEKIESELGITGKPQTLEEMFTAFEQGKYGKLTLMSVVVALIHNEGIIKTFLPQELADYFKNSFEKFNREEDNQNP